MLRAKKMSYSVRCRRSYRPAAGVTSSMGPSMASEVCRPSTEAALIDDLDVPA